MKTEKISYSEAKKRLDDYYEKRKADIIALYGPSEDMRYQRLIELGGEMATAEHALNAIFGF